MSRREDAPLVKFEPRNAGQREALALYEKSDVLFLVGEAGCGKTVAAVGLAAIDVTRYGSKRQHITVFRPSVEAGQSLGYLKGTLAEKLEPFTAPVKYALSKVAYRFPAAKLSFESLGHARGLTLENQVIILEEFQNASLMQIKLAISRMGQGSKVIITGDPSQADIRPTVTDYDCDLDAVLDALEGLQGVGIVDFDPGDSLRHPLIPGLLGRLKELR